MIRGFKDFIHRGNLVEIAVAFVLGVAFASVLTAFTTRIVSPLIGMVFNLSSLETMGTFGPADPETGLAIGSVGAFIQALLNFLLVGLVMYFVVKAYNGMQGPAAPEAEPDPEDVVLLRRIAAAVERR